MSRRGLIRNSIAADEALQPSPRVYNIVTGVPDQGKLFS
jgi:hypothetical protein